MTKRRLQCIFSLRNTIFIISLFFLEYHFLTRQSLITDRRNYRRLYYIFFSKKTFRTTFQILDIIFNPSIITDRRNSDRYKKKNSFPTISKISSNHSIFNKSTSFALDESIIDNSRYSSNIATLVEPISRLSSLIIIFLPTRFLDSQALKNSNDRGQIYITGANKRQPSTLSVAT